MSFLLFKPAVYGNFFATDGTLTLLAGLSMLAGVLAVGGTACARQDDARFVIGLAAR